MPRQPTLWSEDFAPGYVELWARRMGLWPVLGIDEAGRGCLAGPVVAAAVMLADPPRVEGINDSKLLSSRQRERLAALIKEKCIVYGIGVCQPSDIDRLGIVQATLFAMRLAAEQALDSLAGKVGLVVVDGLSEVPGLTLPQKAWPKGDRLSLNCAAASILAKTERDKIMLSYHSMYPEYGFSSHKGYATRQHLEVLASIGPCPIHRRSFAPLKMRPL